MKIFLQGNIVLIPFPFTNQKAFKVRPGLVISNATFNRGADVIIVAISSQGKSHFSEVILRQKDLKSGFLKKTSFIKTGHVVTIEKSLILKAVGEVKEEKLKEVCKKWIEILTPTAAPTPS